MASQNAGRKSMNALEQLSKSKPGRSWRPLGEIGKTIRDNAPLFTALVQKGHGNRAIYTAWGFEDDTAFSSFSTSMISFRRFLRKEAN
jgi:hypothetical protein